MVSVGLHRTRSCTIIFVTPISRAGSVNVRPIPDLMRTDNGQAAAIAVLGLAWLAGFLWL